MKLKLLNQQQEKIKPHHPVVIQRGRTGLHRQIDEGRNDQERQDGDRPFQSYRPAFPFTNSSFGLVLGELSHRSTALIGTS